MKHRFTSSLLASLFFLVGCSGDLTVEPNTQSTLSESGEIESGDDQENTKGDKASKSLSDIDRVKPILTLIGSSNFSGAGTESDPFQISVDENNLLEITFTLEKNDFASSVVTCSFLPTYVTFEPADLKIRASPLDNDSGAQDTFSCKSEAESRKYQEYFIKLTVIPINDAPTLVVNPASLIEDDLLIIGSETLNLTDLEQSSLELTYQLTSIPAYGQLELNNFLLTINDTFTQEDVNQNRLQYRHDGRDLTINTNDSFHFSFTDGTAGGVGEVVLVVSPFCSDKNATSNHQAWGDGTELNPYKICFAEQWQNIGTDTTVWKSYFELKSNIDLASYTGETYNIIGNSTTPFKGSLEGNKRTITNFTYATSASEVGLFGRINNYRSYIRNLKITGASLTCTSNCGILFGRGIGYRLQNIEVAGTVVSDTVSGDIGGVGGYVSGMKVSHIAANVAVSEGNIRIGGLFGSFYASHLFASYHVGDLVRSGSGSGRGGIVGYMMGSNSEEVYHIGNVTFAGSSWDAGGIAGYGRIWKGFAAGNIWVTLTNRASFIGNDSAFAVDTYYDNSYTCTATGGSCLTVGTGLANDGVVFYDKTSAVLNAWDFNRSWVEQVGDYPKLRSDPSFASHAEFSCLDHLTDAPFAGGDGTYMNPYLICTANQLNAISNNSSYMRSHFKLMAHIDLSDLSVAYKVIAAGTSYRGIFDGNGHKISNMSITVNTSLAGYYGLFSQVTDGMVRDLTLENATLNDNSINAHHLGLLSGAASHASFKNIKIIGGTITSAPTSNSNAGGGILGGCSYSFVQDFIVSANVQHHGMVGGVTGDLVNCSISRGYVAGQVTGNGMAGGVVGRWAIGGSVSHVFTSNNVTGDGTKAGRLLGEQTAGTASNNFYDNTKTCTNCDQSTGTTSADPDTFYSKANAPLSSWDFEYVWQENTSSFPSLISP